MVHSFYSSKQPSGENTVVLNEVDALRCAGHEVALFAAHTDELEGEVFYKLRAGIRVATGYGRNPLKAIKDFSPDVVHVHNLFPNLGKHWVEDVTQPLVHTLHNYRPLCANGLLLRDGAVCTDCLDGNRWAGLRHSCYRGSTLATLPVSWAGRGDPAHEPLLRRADLLVVLSEQQRDIYERVGVPAHKLALSPNFLPDDLDPGPAQQEPTDGWLFVGRLTEEKGILRLIEHWPDGEALKIIGDGAQRDQVETEAVRIGATLLPSLPRAEVLKHMRAATGLVFPSASFECAPLVYVEALACGLPVVGFEPSALAVAVEREGTGVAVTQPHEGLHQALEDVRSHSRRLRRRARIVFENRYSQACWVDRAVQRYSVLLNLNSPDGDFGVGDEADGLP